MSRLVTPTSLDLSRERQLTSIWEPLATIERWKSQSFFRYDTKRCAGK